MEGYFTFFLVSLRKQVLMAFLLLAGVPFCFSQPPEIIEGHAQGTSYRIVYYPLENEIKKKEIDLIFSQIDSSLSVYKPYSLIAKFNQKDCNSILMDKHFREVVLSAKKHYKLSKGKFDITIAPLTELYGLRSKNKTGIPSKRELKNARRLVGMKNLKISGDSLIKLKKEIKIDVNGIAQGYSVDLVSEHLENQNIENYLVEVGGEIRTKGWHADNKKFKVALESLNQETGKVEYKTIEITDISVSTSGKINPQKIKHHINPKTGKPFKAKNISCTVFAPTAMDADAYDNYIIGMKKRKAGRFARKQKIRVELQ